MGLVSLNGVFVAAQLWKEVSRWSAEETTAGKAGPELSLPHFPLDKVQEIFYGLVLGKADGSQLCSIFVMYFWLS